MNRDNIAGYHRCTKDEAVRLAAFIYRVRFGESKSEFQSIQSFLRDLVPIDLIKLLSTSEWKKVISAAHAADSGKSPFQASLAQKRNDWFTFYFISL